MHMWASLYSHRPAVPTSKPGYAQHPDGSGRGLPCPRCPTEHATFAASQGKDDQWLCFGRNSVLADSVKNYRWASLLACRQGLVEMSLVEETGPGQGGGERRRLGWQKARAANAGAARASGPVS